MSTELSTVIILLSLPIWTALSQESVKPTKEVNWRKMITLLSLGSISTLVLLVSLFQNLPF